MFPVAARRLLRVLPGGAIVLSLAVGPARDPVIAQETMPSARACPDFGSLNPAAPPETAQFGFLVGRWAVAVRGRTEDGRWDQAVRRAYWEGHYILDGYAVADYWYDYRPADRPDTHRGVNVRLFNTDTAVWDITWQHTEDPLLILHGERRGDDMHLWTEQPDGTLARIVFSDIRPDSWNWLMEVSDDQGASWSPALKIRAERIPC